MILTDERLVLVGGIIKQDRSAIIKGIGIWVARMPHRFFKVSIVGVTIGDHYTPFSDLNKTMQDQVGHLSKLAYENVSHRTPDYEMKNGKLRSINQCAFQELRTLEPKFTDQMQGHKDPNFPGLLPGHIDHEIVADRNFHEADDQQGTSGLWQSSHAVQIQKVRICASYTLATHERK
ncbi:hypothetical protein GUJ93_ZPchr0013g34915 [Zizania palustris]|uniref:Calmodulin binding protein C-terminal domain-containing protein n=1 Tax=Zizania palustris TaxID=103762 RepID=A0A8J5WWK9_ZIZPA|nr:hypothetical protein GUJ93_ZPchr0013g34915 [Zizania palustris]